MTWSLPWRKNRPMRCGNVGRPKRLKDEATKPWCFVFWWFLRKCRAKIRWRVETQPRPKLEVKQKDFCVEEFRKNQLQTEDKTRPDAQRFLLTLTVTHVTHHFCSGSWRLHCHDSENFDHLLSTWKTLWVELLWSNAMMFECGVWDWKQLVCFDQKIRAKGPAETFFSDIFGVMKVFCIKTY